jgi:16S rRNA (cytosine1402-N4)-methyltransferase
MTIHEPVLLREVLLYLDPRPGQNFIDCTFGGGGHALALLEKIRPGGQVIGLDLDEQAIKNFGRQVPGLILVHDNYKNIRKIILDKKNELGTDKISGVLLDLGLSSDQLGSGDRGFSFQTKEFLDLRFSKVLQQVSASDILRTASEQELVDIFKNYGEEQLARPIAKKIIAHRVVDNHAFDSSTLAMLVADIYKRFYKRPSKKHPATKVFQALRIAVNNEYGNIRSGLTSAAELLSSGGRLAVISFHSGEDRIVKNIFRDLVKLGRLKIITKKPIEPTEAEVAKNPRSRSAKLRVAEKI